MSSLLEVFDIKIKPEHKEIYEILKRKNKLKIYQRKMIARSKWYHHFIHLFVLCLINTVYPWTRYLISVPNQFNYFSIGCAFSNSAGE